MDVIADMLTMIRNALAVKKETVSVPYSKLKMSIAEILAKEGYVKEAVKKGRHKKVITLILKYDEDGKPAIREIKRVSKPSRRIYITARQIRPGKKGQGIKILTTPKGVMTDKEAKKENVGGEIICEVV